MTPAEREGQRIVLHHPKRHVLIAMLGIVVLISLIGAALASS